MIPNNDAVTLKSHRVLFQPFSILICSFTGTEIRLYKKSVLGSQSFVSTLVYQASESGGLIFPKLANVSVVILIYALNFGKKNKSLHLTLLKLLLCSY
jgi:hypothetical protein